jgi:16S rRNA (uracil1498-N3)-methyltransferase
VSAPAGAGAEAHAFVDDLDAPALDDEDRHHLERVRRLRAGAAVTVADGGGRWRVTRFGPVLVADGPVQVEEPPSLELTVAFALVKGDRPEQVVQKLTELGIDRIVPMTTERCVVRWDGDRAHRHHERLVKVAREAAMQCRRARLPVVEPVQVFGGVVARTGAVLADAGGGPPTLDHPIVLIGPEGGWSPAERAAADAIGLGSYILRAETAAVAAGVVLAALRANLLAS